MLFPGTVKEPLGVKACKVLDLLNFRAGCWDDQGVLLLGNLSLLGSYHVTQWGYCEGMEPAEEGSPGGEGSPSILEVPMGAPGTHVP